MNFIADECVESQIIEALRNEGHKVYYIMELDRGISDQEILDRSLSLSPKIKTLEN